MTYISTPIINLIPHSNSDGANRPEAVNKMLTAGIIGGLAPQSTASFYQALTDYCLSRNVPNFPNLLINSVNTWEVTRILARKDLDGLYRFLQKEIRKIEEQADFIAIVCNSVHAVIEPLREATSIPVLAIYEEVCREVAKSAIRKIGILGTKTTVDNCFYQKELARYQITTETLPSEQEAAFDAFIFEEMLHGRGQGTMKRLILEGIQQLKAQGCEGVILACTELPLFISQHEADIPLFSSTDILAGAVAGTCLEGGAMRKPLHTDQPISGNRLAKQYAS